MTITRKDNKWGHTEMMEWITDFLEDPDPFIEILEVNNPKRIENNDLSSMIDAHEEILFRAANYIKMLEEQIRDQDTRISDYTDAMIKSNFAYAKLLTESISRQTKGN